MYSFDATNLTVFTGTLTAGSRTGRVPLRLDKDADFYLRGISQRGAVSIRIEDTDGNPLSDLDNPILSTDYELPNEYSNAAGAGLVALESGADGVFGPGGGNYVVYLYNATAATINLATCALNLHGVKRYPKVGCN
jgi:hypothetical protein